MGNLISNRSYRELLETKNVFADPAYCREAWKSVGQAILLSPAIGCIGDIDTRDGAIEEYTYNKLCRELKAVGASTSADGRPVVGRQPTELEMIFHCQAARARFDTSAAVFVRDTVGAKPIDESKVTVGRSQYEDMSDDELEALLRYRQQRDSVTYEAEAAESSGAEGGVDSPDGSIASESGEGADGTSIANTVEPDSTTIADTDTDSTASESIADDSTASDSIVTIADTVEDEA